MRILSFPITFFLSHPQPSPEAAEEKIWRLAAGRMLMSGADTRTRPYWHTSLLNDLRDGACTHGVAAFANRETQALLHGHRRNQLDHQLHVVSRHHHL